MIETVTNTSLATPQLSFRVRISSYLTPSLDFRLQRLGISTLASSVPLFRVLVGTSLSEDGCKPV
jgi:hypothetical protein